ncbi:MAG: hypothetical protein JWP19_822 [Rhodoglobus sp.]|nr:hypothetical protein [Rhodoglobus sp.]
MTEPESISLTAPELHGKVVASQRWSRVTFLHWRIAESVVAPLLPAGVRPDIHDGSSWVGLIAFYLDRATLGGPAIPFFDGFTEINVRVYGVDQRGRRGVYFLTLEASRLAAVLAARTAFSLPYRWSYTSIRDLHGVIEYTASRHSGRGGTKIVARPGIQPMVGDATADFLTARWGLFTTDRKGTVFLPNHHEPWELFSAELITLEDSLLELSGISGVAGRAPDSVLYSPGVTTRFGAGR